MLNNQQPEAFDPITGDALDYKELFHTLQGEGPHVGVPSFFLRLAGCNLQCPWCDTDYTTRRRKMSVDFVNRAIEDLRKQHPGTRLLVITGGEPTRQNLDELVQVVSYSLRIQIESNGVLAPTPIVMNMIQAKVLDYVVSPKTNHISPATKHALCFKYVLSADSIDPEDGLPTKALGHNVRHRVARPPQGYAGKIYVNPMDAGDEHLNKDNMRVCVRSALAFGYTMGMQAHKLWGLE